MEGGRWRESRSRRVRRKLVAGQGVWGEGPTTLGCCVWLCVHCLLITMYRFVLVELRLSATKQMEVRKKYQNNLQGLMYPVG